MLDAEPPVVVNTTPVVALSVLEHLDLLYLLFGSVLIPPAVQREVEAGGKARPGATELSAAPWIKVTPLKDPSRAERLPGLDRGEAEAIALALERQAQLVVLDERLARKHALRLGLHVTGTLGVLLLAKERDLIPALAPLLDRLEQGGIHLAKRLVEETLQLAGETPQR